MNNEILSLLQGAMIRELGKAIKTHKEDFDIANCNVTDVFKNIELIYEEIPEVEFGSPTGRSMKFMPKRYKEMIMRLVSPECAFTYAKKETETAISVETFLYLDRLDDKPIASGIATISFSSIETPDMDSFTIKKLAETIARGQSESKALQKFGIGAWFRYELEEENPDVMLDQAKKKLDFAPSALPSSEPVSAVKPAEISPVSTEENTEKKGRKPAKKETEEVKEETPAVVSPQNEENTALSDELAAARAVVCKHGKASGMTLGEIETKYPANIVWIYTQDSCDYKDSIKTIILNNPAIKGYADQKGLKF